jgi:hypothetical protein
MILDELKRKVLALPPDQFRDFVLWTKKIGENHEDLPGTGLDQLAAEIWDQDDRRVPPTHPAG